MAEMQEVGAALHDLLDPAQTDGLHQMVEATIARALTVQQGVTEVLAGSRNEHAQALRARLADVTQALGDIAANLAFMDGSHAALRATWGLGGGSSIDAQTAHAGDALAAAPPNPDYLRSVVQARLDRTVDTMFKQDARPPTGPARAQGTLIAGELGACGVQSAGDVLLVGRRALLTFPRMSTGRVDMLATALRTAYPDVPLLERPGPAFAARLRNSLDQVPWACLVMYPDVWGTGYKRTASVQDILTLPRERLLGGLSDYQYNELRTLAQTYAAEFEAAKRTLQAEESPVETQ